MSDSDDKKSEKDETIVCRCRDITVSEIEEAIDDGCDNMELLKRRIKLSTGTCQGRTCVDLARRVLAEKTGKSPSEVKLTRTRTPIIPVPLKFLGGKDE
ncbi:hypothetical protein AKJ37_03205 [candidate division MSBL1 archaeon SCGC-AAA259I09]|uniref:SoxA A3 domain-containing protein n=3 Tax=candidate division MSBL1 TaxID=215777 RepID=A0A133USW6_9EURY|nr:hypothetical protein AKJ61_00570 [candidate division MSBL1 archaeon SCGC-AAA259B11]KXA93553.1 hypothetical protein AKJ66_01760 [candidate division MSBL1 archaeon SCGC-AAA259E22]KXA97331.1 hypothetical protein AKJ37_03205 [candidate division MSBL1 archaeon SCGC-AAA259I09]